MSLQTLECSFRKVRNNNITKEKIAKNEEKFVNKLKNKLAKS